MILSEYLIFNLVVFIPPFAFGMTKWFSFRRQLIPALLSILLVVPWFVFWDSLVTERHWWFNSKYIAGIFLFGLPVEEVLFFITVPFACLFTWEMVLRRTEPLSQRRLIFVYPIGLLIGFTGIPLWFVSREYTALALFSLAISAAIDYGLRTRLLQQPRFWAYLVLAIVFTLIFNGYLTARPVVLYDPQYQLNMRIFTIPIEDFIYGLSLIIACASVFERLKSGHTFIPD